MYNNLRITSSHRVVHNLVSYLARTTVEDVARVESQTFICSERKEDTVPTSKEGVAPILGNWKSPQIMDKELTEKFTGCMKGEMNTLSYMEMDLSGLFYD